MAFPFQTRQLRSLLEAIFVIILAAVTLAGPKSSRRYEPDISGDESRAAFPDIHEAFPDDEDHLDNLQALEHLSAHRELSKADRKYILALGEYLIDKRHVWTYRDRAARYLGIYGHSLAIPALLAVIRDENDNEEVRVSAIYALGQIRDPRTVLYLLEDGFGTGDRTLIMATWESLGFLISDVPDKLKSNNLMGYEPPPGAIIPPGTPIEERPPINPEKLTEYIETWRQWWRENHEEVELRRVFGRA